MTTILPTRATRSPNAPAAPAPTSVLQPHNQFFSPEVQAELANSDHEAWTAVCTVLIAIVTLGLVIGIGAVLLTL
jgi:hypothetical protein